MFSEQEHILVKLFDKFVDKETGERLPFTEKEIVKSNLISKLDLEDFDELFDEGLIDVYEMDEVFDGSKDIEYVIAKEAIEYLKSK